MKDTVLDISELDISGAITVLAVLEGGPAAIPHELRIQTVSPLEEKIKVPYYGGYEHFERTGGFDENSSSQHIVYRWTTRTEMAE
jgi:hypothetical protein